MAVIPGTTAISTSRQAAGPWSMASQTAAAIAKTPGSPPETTATRAPAAAAVKAASARLRFGPIVGGMGGLIAAQGQPRQIGGVAVKHLGAGDFCTCLGGQIGVIAGAEPDHRQPPAHGRSRQPATKTSAK